MTFIANPYGSGGYGFAQPIDLTSGVQAVQRSEIQQKLRDRETSRQVLREDEKWMLTQMPEQVDAMRMKMAGTISKEVEGFKKLQTSVMAASKGSLNGIPIEQKMNIANEMRRINSVVGDEQTFIKQYQEIAPRYSEFRKTLTTDEDIAGFDKALANVQRKISDPNYKATGLDLLEPLTPPPIPAYKTYDAIDKELMPKVKDAIKPIGGGKTAINEPMALDIIGKNLVGRGPSLDSLGVSSGAFSTPEEKNKFFLDRLKGSIHLNNEGWRPTGSGSSQKNKFSGSIVGDYNSAVEINKKTKAFYFSDWGTPIIASFTPPGSTGPTSAEMRPLGLRDDGKLEVKATITKETTTEPMSETSAMFFAQMNNGKKLPPDKSGKSRVVYNQPATYTAIVPYTGDLKRKIEEKVPDVKGYYDSLELPGESSIKKSQADMDALVEKKKQERLSSTGIKTKTFSVAGKTYNIPLDKVDQFKKAYPNAK